MSYQVDHMGRMMAIWNIIEACIQRNAPDIVGNLYPGTTEQQLQAAEAVFGFSLPADLKASWLLHDGTADNFLGGWGLLTLERMLRVYREERTFVEWSSQWLPFAADGCGGHLCVDMDASKGEQMGQIVFFDHELGESFVAPSFWLLMSTFVNDLEDGEYEVDEFGRLVSDEISFAR